MSLTSSIIALTTVTVIMVTVPSSPPFTLVIQKFIASPFLVVQPNLTACSYTSLKLDHSYLSS